MGDYTSKWDWRSLCAGQQPTTPPMSVNNEMHAQSLSRFLHVARGRTVWPCSESDGDRSVHICGTNLSPATLGLRRHRLRPYESPRQVMHRRAGAAQLDERSRQNATAWAQSTTRYQKGTTAALRRPLARAEAPLRGSESGTALQQFGQRQCKVKPCPAHPRRLCCHARRHPLSIARVGR